MAQIRIATVNVENLLQRFNFHTFGRLTVEPSLRILGVEPGDEDYMALRKSLFVSLTDDSRQQTAQLVRDTAADIICLQEVESKEVLDDFHDQYLKKSARVHYGWRRLLRGNDLRGINVGVMAKNRIEVTSNAELTFDDFNLFNDELRDYGLSEGDRIFRRDCLRVTTKVGDKELSIYVCHFKSMAGGSERTMPVRRAEAAAVRKIIQRDFGGNAKDGNWLIAGDLNAYIEEDGTPVAEHGIAPLLEGDFSVNIVENLPREQRWTHYFPREDSKHQLDYLLASPAIAASNDGVQPDIIRGGQPYRVPGLDITRYPRVGFDRPKATDHCAVAATLEV